MKQIIRAIVFSAVLLIAGQATGSQDANCELACPDHGLKAERAALSKYLQQEQKRIKENNGLPPTSSKFTHQWTYCVARQNCRCSNPIPEIIQALNILDIRIATLEFNSKQK